MPSHVFLKGSQLFGAKRLKYAISYKLIKFDLYLMLANLLLRN